MKKIFFLGLLMVVSTLVFAQRKMETLDRGLVAVKSGSGIYLSWRILGEEYYDVTYNLYRNDEKLNVKPLEVSNYRDASGTVTDSYTVTAVVRGEEQSPCSAVTAWSQNYMEIALQKVYSRRGADITSRYEPNDACAADLDGDGVMEILLKRLNMQDNADLYPAENDSAYEQLEAYKLDGTKLWSIDCGPNMVSGGSVELNIVAFDWDEDGKAEVLLRGADGMIIHYNGGDRLVGSATVNTRNTISHSANMTYTNSGAEYLIYMNGETGEPYQVITYPLARGSADDWGDGYGHRSSKYFFGAPYLDGRKPSIFLARGIYTKHVMAAYDVDGTTHTLQQRWRWSDPGGAWYGQGFHNYGIADVDWDGRDEIVYGNLVLDDNGKGLHSTGLGHGDAQHCSDLDPYRHGQEIFVCGENSPGCNLRNATTGKIYYRYIAGRDDGRAIAGNFTDKYPGSIAFSARSAVISCVTDRVLSDGTKDGTDENFRIYWDGDLCEETFNYTTCVNYLGSDPRIVKYGSWTALTTFSGTYTNNATKGTACLQADLFGDWREEVVLRDKTNQKLRIYTTTLETPWRNYTLLHDMQYRQGVLWQICGYNQPPHTSYFLGAKEGITVAPPPLMTNGRSEVANGATIDGSLNDKHILLCETNDMTVAVADGAAPYITTANIPTWVQGSTNNSNIKTTTYTCTLTGGAFDGAMRLVKQGDGVLVLPNVTETYTGETNVWAGTLSFDGTMQNSPVWLNRFARLLSNGGHFMREVKMDYASALYVGGADNAGEVTVDTLTMNFGSRLVIDIYSENFSADLLKSNRLTIGTIAWSNGPQYSTPIIEFNQHNVSGEKMPAGGRYLIAEIDSLAGNVSSIVIEGLSGVKSELAYEDGKLYLLISGMRDACSITWMGDESNVWDLATGKNFFNNESKVADFFVTGDKVIFNDEATNFNVKLAEDIQADTILVDNTTSYAFSGTGSIGGGATLVKSGGGVLTIGNENSFTGGAIIKGGTVKVSSLSNEIQATGNLGACTASASKFVIENGAVLQNTAEVKMGSPIRIGEGGAVITTSATFTMNKAFSGTTLTKRGGGTLNMAGCSVKKLSLEAGWVSMTADFRPADTVEFAGGKLQDCNDNGSYSSSTYNVSVPEGKTGTWNLDCRCVYSNRLTGAGTLTVYRPDGSRTQLQGNWSAFTGTIKATASGTLGFPLDNSYGLPNATLDVSSGITVDNSGKSFAIGKITGGGSLGGSVSYSQSAPSGNNTWRIGNDTDYKWEGKVTGTGTSFVKIGSGKLTLSAAHDFTGAAKVSEGELQITNGTKLGTGVLTVDAGAVLSGVSGNTNSLTNSSANINGTLQVGSAAIGVMDFGDKNVTFGASSKYVMGIRRCASVSSSGGSVIRGINRLTMNGTLAPYLSTSYTPVDGDSVRVWECSAFAGTPKLELPQLPDGFEWRTDRINEGLLFVAAVTAVGQIEADEEVEVIVTTTEGVAVEHFKALYSEVGTLFKELPLAKGMYLLGIKGKTTSQVQKMIK